MNVLTIYLPWGKIGIASDLRKVKTADVHHVEYTVIATCHVHCTYTYCTYVQYVCINI